MSFNLYLYIILTKYLKYWVLLIKSKYVLRDISMFLEPTCHLTSRLSFWNFICQVEPLKLSRLRLHFDWPNSLLHKPKILFSIPFLIYFVFYMVFLYLIFNFTPKFLKSYLPRWTFKAQLITLAFRLTEFSFT